MTRQAALRIGTVSLAAPELKWPMNTIASGSLAAVVAFCCAKAPTPSPLFAVEDLADRLDERVGLSRVRALARQRRVHVDLVRARALLVLADLRLCAGRSAAGSGSRCSGRRRAGREDEHRARGDRSDSGEL